MTGPSLGIDRTAGSSSIFQTDDEEISSVSQAEYGLLSVSTSGLDDDDEAPLVLQKPEKPLWFRKVLKAFDPRINFRDTFVPPSRQGQLQMLDLVRTVAVWFVVIFHSWVFLWDHMGDPGVSDLSKSLLMRLVRNGELSVDMFFGLSGFLIAYVLIREHDKDGRISVPRFYLRRWLRIFPAMGFILAVYWPAFSAIGCENCQACNKYGWMNLLFINNFAPSIGGCMQWTWSLATEMQYYVVSPFIMIVYTKWPRVGAALFALLLAASLAIRGAIIGAYEFYVPGRPDGGYMDVVMIKPYTRFGPYILGMVAACIYEAYRARCVREGRDTAPAWVAPLRYAAMPAALLLCAVVVVWGEGYEGERTVTGIFAYLMVNRTVFGLGISAFTLCVLIGAAVPRAKTTTVVSRAWHVCTDFVLGLRLWYVCAQLGYTVFLLHPIWVYLFYMLLPAAPVFSLNFGWFVLLCITNIVVTSIVALFVHAFVERPFMNLR